MKIKLIKCILFPCLILIASYSCSHCDDEDYTRDQKKQATFKLDSLGVKTME